MIDVIRKMQIKNHNDVSLLYSYQDGKQTKTDSTKCRARMQSNWNSQTLLVGTQNSPVTLQDSVMVSRKVNHAYHTIQQSTPRCLYKRNKGIGPHESLCTNVTAALFTKAPNQKQPKHPLMGDELPTQQYSHRILVNSEKNEPTHHTIWRKSQKHEA